LLNRLTIQNFGIIERLEWSPVPGLNVITGETGAGKSLVLDALDVLMGRRVGQEVIRPPSGLARDALTGVGYGGMSVVLRREVERNGRGSAAINGQTVTVRSLRELAVHFFELHGPNQQFSLLDGYEQLLLLDAYAGLGELRERFSSVASDLRDIRKRIQSITTDEHELARRRDMLSFEVSEIRRADLKLGEEARLLEEAALLSKGSLGCVRGTAGWRLVGAIRYGPDCWGDQAHQGCFGNGQAARRTSRDDGVGPVPA